MPMEVANAGNERRICENAGFLGAPLGLPASSSQPDIHHQTPHLPGVLRLWAGVRLAQRQRTSASRPQGQISLSPSAIHPCGRLRVGDPIALAGGCETCHVSYLAQTRPFVPVMIDG